MALFRRKGGKAAPVRDIIVAMAAKQIFAAASRRRYPPAPA